MPTWVPVLFGVLTPIFFTTNGALTKHLTGHRRKGAKPLTAEEQRRVFDAGNLSFTAYLVTNVIVLIAAIPYWVIVDFDFNLFWIGIVGAVINTLGLVSVQVALSSGPSGPVSALTTVQNVALVIIEAIKNKRVPNPYEFVGLIFGMAGALILVIPEYLCPCCIRKKKENEDEEDNKDGKKEELKELLPKNAGVIDDDTLDQQADDQKGNKIN